jgi:hypothetical protein
MKYKSIKNSPATAFLVALAIPFAIGLSQDDSSIVEYYWRQAGAATAAHTPDTRGVSYHFTARTFYHRIGEGGRITKTDSATQRYYFTDGAVDSVNTLQGDAGRFDNLDLTYPLIFEMDYHLNLFPNDTGGPRLPIGLVSDSASRGQPDGLLVIDRYEYLPQALYLHYPDLRDYKRFTRSYRFTRVDDYLFLDSIWEVATKLGVLFTESYRLETGITDIEVTRSPE